MYRQFSVVVFTVVLALYAQTSSAHALGWARSGDAAACLRSSPSSDACSRVHWTYYVWPHFLRELEAAMGKNWQEPQPNPWKRLRPEPDPWVTFYLQLVYPNPEDPNPPICPICLEAFAVAEALIQPPARKVATPGISREVRLNDLRVFRAALTQTMNNLDREIKALEAGQKRGQ